MKAKLENIRQEFVAQLSVAENLQVLDEIRVKYLGKKGELTAILRGMGALTAEERPVIGQFVNETRDFMTEEIEKLLHILERKQIEEKLANEFTDVTMPSKKIELGNLHPMTIILDDIKDIFIGMGFTIEEGPEIEYANYNFDKLNHTKHHPARDVQDTFYFDEDLEILLRTQTSPMQARVMENQAPPIRVIVPGRVYRADEIDATHSPMFHQIEGLVVDKGITMANLKGTLDTFVKKLFGDSTKTKFRPHHFPFTEPSAEVDCTCFKCKGEGCRMCKFTGWIEILGCGMVHPNVLRNCGIDPEVYSGFAFGMGLDRVALLRLGIDDLRLMYDNDKRFLSQF